MRQVFAALGLVVSLAACEGDPAVQMEARWEACAMEPVHAARITACTAVLRDPALDPDRRAGAYLNRGAARSQLGQWTRALADFGRALRIDANLASAHFERGLIHYNRGAYAVAVGDFDAALALDPDLLSAAQWRETALGGVTEMLEGRLSRIEDALTRDPLNAGHYNERCWLRAVEGIDLDLALADCNESLRLRGADAATLDSRGLVQLKRGDYAAALADYDAAVALDGANGHYLYGRGLARLGLAMPEGAADLARAGELDPRIALTYRGYDIAPDTLQAASAPK